MLLGSCVGDVFAAIPSSLQFTLSHQLVHSESVKDVTPRGVITYDPTTNSASYDAQSEVVDLGSSEGIYRIGLYDTTIKDLRPAAFTKLGSVNGPVNEEITLHVSSENVVYHISYVLKPSRSPTVVVKVLSDRMIPDGPAPKLNIPVVVNPDGQPPVEEVEKTFLQKYWMYLLPVAILIITSGGAGGGEQAAN